jgi:hypothetical protein
VTTRRPWLDAILADIRAERAGEKAPTACESCGRAGRHEPSCVFSACVAELRIPWERWRALPERFKTAARMLALEGSRETDSGLLIRVDQSRASELERLAEER